MADDIADLMRVLFDEWQRGFGGPHHVLTELLPEAQAGWRAVAKLVEGNARLVKADTTTTPVPMRLHCPECGGLHVDEGEFATKLHHTHACQECGAVWRPAIVPTVGVRFLPGFKNP